MKIILDMMGKRLEGTDVAMCKNCHGMQTCNDLVYTHDFSR